MSVDPLHAAAKNFAPARSGPSAGFSRRSLVAGGLVGLGIGRLLAGRPRTFTQAPELPPRTEGTLHRLLAVGDIGLVGETRDLVVAEMAVCMESAPATAVLLLGDNFYPRGVASVDDEQWQSKFEQLFPRQRFPVPFQACLGNHDHNGDTRAQVEYTRRSGRWRMPAEYYSFQLPLEGDRTADFFVLDTQRIWKDHADGTPQLRWLEDSLARSRATWKVVIGHHCIRSYGAHGPIAEIGGRIEPLLERHSVDLYVSGHDHDLQLLRTDAGWVHVVSGAGSCLRETGRGPDTLFAAARPGFAALALGPEELRVEFHAAREGLVHAHSIRRTPRVPARADNAG